jgi:hypothetical protein
MGACPYGDVHGKMHRFVSLRAKGRMGWDGDGNG